MTIFVKVLNSLFAYLMKKSLLLFAANIALILSMTSCQNNGNKHIVDVQAHRGGMGLRPANTLAAMKHAIDLGVNTLEMDLVISKDNKVILCHDRYFTWQETTHPNSTPITREEPKIYLWSLPYDEIVKYDVGQRQHPDFPEQSTEPAKRPLLSDVLTFTERYAKEKGIPPLKYNIEIKSHHGYDGGVEGKDWPEFHHFADTCIAVLESFNLGDRLIVQSFDERALSYINIKYPDLILAYLVGGEEVIWKENNQLDFDKILGSIGFIPEWFSPASVFVSEAAVSEAHRRGMKVVTWTVDSKEEMQRMIDCGVDAIISNYPDRLLEVVKNQ